MKVFNLACEHQHGFEGWFASESDFEHQVARELLACPVCNSLQIARLPSAPRLNFGAKAVTDGSNRPTHSAPDASTNLALGKLTTDSVSGRADMAMQAAWMHVARQVLSHTEDVGSRFAEEARKIHYGESEERGIRGQATREQTESLLEEGIAVMPLLLPEFLKNPLH
jgi:hypothetical protein